MAKAKKKTEETKTGSETAAKSLSPSSAQPTRLCPTCGIKVTTHRCAQCRAVVEVQPVSGLVIWSRNGRIVRAFRNEHQAYMEVANGFNITTSE